MRKLLLIAICCVMSMGFTAKSENVFNESRAGKFKPCAGFSFGYLRPDGGGDKFSFSFTTELGARYWIANSVFAEAMVGYKPMIFIVDDGNLTYHNISLPLHLGYVFPSESKVKVGLHAGGRVNIPVSVKYGEEKASKKTTTLMFETGLTFSFSDWALRLQYGYSPNDYIKCHEISLGISMPF